MSSHALHDCDFSYLWNFVAEKRQAPEALEVMCCLSKSHVGKMDLFNSTAVQYQRLQTATRKHGCQTRLFCAWKLWSHHSCVVWCESEILMTWTVASLLRRKRKSGVRSQFQGCTKKLVQEEPNKASPAMPMGSTNCFSKERPIKFAGCKLCRWGYPRNKCTYLGIFPSLRTCSQLLIGLDSRLSSLTLGRGDEASVIVLTQLKHAWRVSSFGHIAAHCRIWNFKTELVMNHFETNWLFGWSCKGTRGIFCGPEHHQQVPLYSKMVFGSCNLKQLRLDHLFPQGWVKFWWEGNPV